MKKKYFLEWFRENKCISRGNIKCYYSLIDTPLYCERSMDSHHIDAYDMSQVERSLWYSIYLKTNRIRPPAYRNKIFLTK